MKAISSGDLCVMMKSPVHYRAVCKSLSMGSLCHDEVCPSTMLAIQNEMKSQSQRLSKPLELAYLGASCCFPEP